MAKMLLDRQGINYRTVNVETDRKAMNDLLNQGFRSLPVTMKEGMVPEEFVVGFQPDRLKALCG
jgi:glutaredoxin